MEGRFLVRMSIENHIAPLPVHKFKTSILKQNVPSTDESYSLTPELRWAVTHYGISNDMNVYNDMIVQATLFELCMTV